MSKTRTNATRIAVAMVVAVTVLSAATFAPASAGAAAPYCGITWGSAAKADPHMTGAPITNLRAGRQSCFDRLVVDLRAAPAPGYNVAYVSQFTDDGSGKPIPLRGGADLAISVLAPAHDSAMIPTYSPPNKAEAVNVAGFTTFRQVYFNATFEGVTTLGLGVRARLPFRVFTLAGPGAGTRLVIDVAHRWT